MFVQLFILFWYVAHGEAVQARHSFSFFTVLTYWGITFYFLVASIHTFAYARTGSPYLDRFPRQLQALHSLYYTSVTTYPFLVTIVYWGILFSGPWFTVEFSAWSNISQHAMNSVFALFEIIFTRTDPLPLIHLFWLIVILALYCGLAYVTKATRNYYVYPFLDPSGGHSGRVAVYVVILGVAIVIIWTIVRLVIWTRKWVTETKMQKKGKFYNGRNISQGEVELEAVQVWEK
jgi:hypothetical protein